ncbi:MAG: glycosyltransferase [Chthoniobacterales bacterium]|nr:glycosyltransferase [Chthoniobacterales bacterium]
MTSSSSRLSWAARAYRKTLAHYLNLIISKDASLLEIGSGEGVLLQQLHGARKTGIDADAVAVAAAATLNPDAEVIVAKGEFFTPTVTPDYILLADTLNHVEDVQAVLEKVRSYALPSTRLVISCYNTLWRPVLAVATWLRLRAPQEASNWLSRHDLENLIELADWETIRKEARILCPIEIPLIAPFLNRWIAPLLPACCLTIIFVARPREVKREVAKTVSVIIPARNESGNIEAAIARTPEMGAWTELIFVEGNSTDDTWTAIQKVQTEHPERRIKIAQQPGRGKGDAMRTGYALAEGEIVMILDADLTMPPEDLPKFYHAVANGSCEFANGSRLVYPMEEKAMQFCNLCVNKIFGIIFSWLLGQQVKDTLCGTKVIMKENYLKIAANRSYFGEFDPFGDFDLLFGASKLNLKIRDIPVRYRERTYGTTNITRWSAGMLLLRMIIFAARKLKFV